MLVQISIGSVLLIANILLAAVAALGEFRGHRESARALLQKRAF